MTKTSGIYKIICVPTQKYYYGSSADIDRRWADHKHDLAKDGHANIYLQRAWKKYGKEAFIIEVVELVELAKLLEVETVYLKEHASRPECFNLALDATAPMLGRKHGEEACSKMSKSHTGVSLVGEHRRKSVEHCRKMNEAKKGTVASEMTRRKMSEVRRGKTISEETRRRMREAQKGRLVTKEQRNKISVAVQNRQRDWHGRYLKEGII